MNYSMISYILGWIFNFEAAFMLLPGITAIIYREKDGLAFLVTMIICLAIGIPLIRTKRKNKVFHAKEGAVTVALSSLVLSIAGALPFVISGSIPHPVDACLRPFRFYYNRSQHSFRCGVTFPTVSCCGEALPTGSGVWECWCLSFAFCL